MSILRRIFGQDEDASRALQGMPGWGPGMTWTPGMPSPWWKDGGSAEAMRLSAVYACIRLISEAIASMPLDVYKKVGDRRVQQQLPKVLRFDRPGPSRIEYLSQVMLSLLSDGNAYIAITYSDAGVPVMLQPLDPCMVTVRIDERKRVVFDVAGVSGVFSALDIMHIKGMSMPGALKGMSPLSYARETIDVGLSAQGFGSRYFANGAMPSAVIEAPNGMTPEAVERWRATWNGNHQGTGNAGKIGVLSGGASFKQVSINPTDSQFLETRAFQVADIARFYGVPPHLIADASNSTSWGSGLAEQNLAFGQFSLRPWLSRIEEAHTALIAPSAAFMKLNMDALLRASLSDRYASYATGIAAGFLEPNEARAWEDLPPLPSPNDPPPGGGL